MDHATLFLFGSGCASLGFAARWIAVSIEERIIAHRELQASCEHTWGKPFPVGGYPVRHCKWCKKQQHYISPEQGGGPEGEWTDW